MVLHPHQGYTSGDENSPKTGTSTRKVHEQRWQLVMRAKVKRRGDSSRTAGDKRVDPSVSLGKIRN